MGWFATRWFVLVAIAACTAGPRREDVAEDHAFVRRQLVWACGPEVPARCVIADTASMWREQRATLGDVGARLADDWCQFEVDRAIVVVLPGPFAEPVAIRVHSEEGVDVVTLTPRCANPAPGHALVVVLVVPARDHQLAVVAQLPTAQGVGAETTLAVFAGR